LFGHISILQDGASTSSRNAVQDISVALLTCGIESVFQKELQVLRGYEFGKPVQPQEEIAEGKKQGRSKTGAGFRS
jgi:hypothetical protein